MHEIHFDEKTGQAYKVHRQGNQAVLVPVAAQEVAGYFARGLPSQPAPDRGAPVVRTPPPDAGPVCHCKAAPHPHRHRVHHGMGHGGGGMNANDMAFIRQEIANALSPVLDVGQAGNMGCDLRPPLYVPRDANGCADEKLVCNESLPIGPINIPAGTIVPIPVTPFDSFQPQILLYSGGFNLRIASVFIKGKNQLGANQQLNPNNYTSVGNYNRINWEDIHAAIPVTLNVINLDPLVDETFEAEIKGPSIR